MVQKFWRVRLGAAKKGFDRFEKVFNLCKKKNRLALQLVGVN